MIEERELTPDEAHLRLNKLCERLSLTPSLDYSDNTKLTATCALLSATGEEISSGAGKGVHCALGALAESLEHYFLDHEQLSAARKVPARQLTQSQRYRDDWLIRSIADNTIIHAFELTAVDSAKTLPVPAALLNPSKPYASAIKETQASFLRKYASNSGMALGCTENEAILHALNECIERHALSVLYLSACGLMRKPTLYRPSDELIRASLDHNRAATHHADNLEVFLTCDFYGLFFCIAVGPKTEGSLTVIGSGCASSAQVAISRAVTEQIQCTHLQGEQEVQEDASTYQMLSQFNTLYNLIHPRLESDEGVMPCASKDVSLRSQIRRTVENLKRQGREVFIRTLYHEPGIACVVQAYIPGLERFHLIRSGLPVVSQHALSKGARGADVYL